MLLKNSMAIDNSDDWLRYLTTLVGSIFGFFVGFFQFFNKRARKENAKITDLQLEVMELRAELQNFKIGFSLVFDEYERANLKHPEKIAMLKDLRKLLNL